MVLHYESFVPFWTIVRQGTGLVSETSCVPFRQIPVTTGYFLTRASEEGALTIPWKIHWIKIVYFQYFSISYT